jgi:hypothetical protein
MGLGALLTLTALLAQDPLKRITAPNPPAPERAPFESGRFVLRPHEVVVLTGPTNVVLEQQVGWIETLLAAAAREARPRFRPMGWEGDTVYLQERDINFGGWKQQLEAAGASTVFAWFGQIEALDPTRSADDFAAAYGKLLDEFRAVTPRLVVVAPMPFERPAGPWIPDRRSLNVRVKAHAEAARRLAAERGAIFVDPFEGASGLTENGMHLTAEGDLALARRLAAALGLQPPAEPEALRREIVAKNALWFAAWRPGNWCFA